jgi:hypothetical protein
VASFGRQQSMEDLSPDEVRNPSNRCRAHLRSLLAATVAVRKRKASGDPFGRALGACFLPPTLRSSTAFPMPKVEFSVLIFWEVDP